MDITVTLSIEEIELALTDHVARKFAEHSVELMDVYDKELPKSLDLKVKLVKKPPYSAYWDR
jgi:hypothetical protein